MDFKKGNGLDELDMTRLASLLKDVGDRVDRVEVYYNPYALKTPELPGVKAEFHKLFEGV